MFESKLLSRPKSHDFWDCSTECRSNIDRIRIDYRSNTDPRRIGKSLKSRDVGLLTVNLEHLELRMSHSA